MSTSAPAAPVPTPLRLLQTVDRLLGMGAAPMTGVWPRAAALLLRLALEEGLRQYWHRVRPELLRCPTHAQTLCLAEYAGPALGRRWSSVWAALSRACHYHGYELNPTPAELRSWRDEVAALLGALLRSPR